MAKSEQFQTEIVTLNWPKLIRPDVYRGKVKPGEKPPLPSYKTDFKFKTPEETEAFRKKLHSAGIKAFGKGKVKLPVKVVDAEGKTVEAGEQGEMVFYATSKYKPALFDSQNGAIKGEPRIWGGTEGRLALGLNLNGREERRVALYLNAVQIVKLVEGDAPGVKESPFAQIEGGFVSTEEEGDESPFGNNDDEGGDDDSGSESF